MEQKSIMRRSEDYTSHIGYWYCSDGRIIERETGNIVRVYDNGGVRLKNANGKMVNMQAHRIIASTFVPNPDRLKFVGFKDGDSTNLAADNLEWVRSGKVISQQTQDILQMYRMGRTSVEIAYHFGVTPQYVNRLLKDHRN